ncbi:triose-phosphate isomerase [Spirochaetia bacterium]|nr:triose-phosphate isomerase [Spirochaetia bacterium]
MIKAPFFEFGPKAYMYGEEILKLAEYADKLAVEFDVDIILDPQTIDIPVIAGHCKHIHIFAQHMDGIPVGRGMGALLPEALKAAGADGTLLNHTERRLSLTDLELTINRARELGLMTMVCADNPAQAVGIAGFSPDSIVVESPDQIGAGNRTREDNDAIARINARIHGIDPRIRILHAAGIKTAQDVYNVIAAGSEGSGSSSGITNAEDPYKMLHDMVEAVRKAWDKRNI